VSVPKQYFYVCIEYCAMENLGGIIQFMRDFKIWVLTTDIYGSNEQGDQIGRIFAYRAIIFFRYFVENDRMA
jgi:hypothetical protein